MATFQNNNTSIYHETHGAGAPLLLIAGLGSDSQSWLPVVPALSAHFQVILFDNRGCGRTTPMDEPTEMEQLVDDCIKLLDHLQLPSAHILGHSMGGMVAQLLAAAHPERVDKLLLAATTTKLAPREQLLLEDWAVTRATTTDLKAWFRNLFYWIFSPAFFENQNILEQALAYALAYPYPQTATGFANQVNTLKHTDTTNLLHQIKADTLLIQGELDILFPPAQTVPLLQTIPAVSTTSIPRAAHSIHMEQPDTFAKTVIQFCSPR